MAAGRKQTITFRRVVHLSHVVEPGMPRWPGDPETSFETVATRAADGYLLRRVSIGEHSGTHANAPLAFHDQGAAISDYEAGDLVAPAVVIDLRERAANDPDLLLSRADVVLWERRQGRIPPRCVVLLHTGWHERWRQPGAFLGLDASGQPRFPGFGVDAAEFLLAARQAAGLGIDTHGLDGGRDSSFAVNRLVLEKRRLALENLAHLDRLPPTGATVVVGVLRLAGGSGSPAAVLALVP